MADQQLEDLGTLSAGTIAADDAFLVNDDSDTTNDAGGEPKTITFRHLRAAIGDLSTFTGRLTLESGKYLSTTDQAAKSTIYLTGPEGGNVRTWLYDGSNWNVFSFAQISLALSGLTSGKPYDVFLYDSSGTPTLELLVWTNDTTRATALSTQDGVVVKSGAATRRYVGTIYTSGTTTTEDTAAKRYVWNYYNRVRRPVYVEETTSSWTYASSTIRQARASSNNQVDVVVGIAGASVLNLVAMCASSNPVGQITAICIGEDSTTAVMAGSVSGLSATDTSTGNNHYGTCIAQTSMAVPLGKHYYAWLERSDVSTTTFYGTNTTQGRRSGLCGNMEC